MAFEGSRILFSSARLITPLAFPAHVSPYTRRMNEKKMGAPPQSYTNFAPAMFWPMAFSLTSRQPSKCKGQRHGIHSFPLHFRRRHYINEHIPRASTSNANQTGPPAGEMGRKKTMHGTVFLSTAGYGM